VCGRGPFVRGRRALARGRSALVRARRPFVRERPAFARGRSALVCAPSAHARLASAHARGRFKHRRPGIWIPRFSLCADAFIRRRADFAPKGRRNVATGGAPPAASRAERNPWRRSRSRRPAPEGQRIRLGCVLRRARPRVNSSAPALAAARWAGRALARSRRPRVARGWHPLHPWLRPGAPSGRSTIPMSTRRSPGGSGPQQPHATAGPHGRCDRDLYGRCRWPARRRGGFARTTRGPGRCRISLARRGQPRRAHPHPHERPGLDPA
jgi:hypothetical protein